MEVDFHPMGDNCSNSKPFSIEIGYFDTVLEIKQKIQNYQNIPISKQTFILNDNILEDELNVFHSNILDKSKIQLLLTSDSGEEPEINKLDPTSSSSSSSKNKIQILVKIPPRLKAGMVEIYPDDTIRKLKDEILVRVLLIHEEGGVNDDNNNNKRGLLCVQANGVELQDHRTVRDCELSDSSEIDVTFRMKSSMSGGSSPTAVSNNNSSSGGGTVKVEILVNGVGGGDGKRKIPFEVKYGENVGELKKQLQRLKEFLHLNLPAAEGFFFIHKQNVMDDDRSFRWHHVAEGDILEIFSGTISGGGL